MKPYNVDELIEWLQAIKKHYGGEHIVLVSNDEECNGYHPLFSWAACEGEPIEFYDQITESMVTKPTIQIG